MHTSIEQSASTVQPSDTESKASVTRNKEASEERLLLQDPLRRVALASPVRPAQVQQLQGHTTGDKNIQVCKATACALKWRQRLQTSGSLGISTRDLLGAHIIWDNYFNFRVVSIRFISNPKPKGLK